jgi:hydroxyethylthiazole kinase
MSLRDLEPAIAAIASLRRKGAAVHCITNTVAQNFTANVLLACNARPSMTADPAEAPHFTRRADALLLNLGTLDADRRKAMRACLAIASQEGRPAILDPVMCHFSPPRLDFARELIRAGADGLIVKCNGEEAAALGDLPRYAVVTGATDRILTPSGEIRIANGDALMGRVIATGCALGALIAALRAHAADPSDAALGALVWFGVAAQIAARQASGPGSFAPAFLDALYTVNADTLRKEARLS